MTECGMADKATNPPVIRVLGKHDISLHVDDGCMGRSGPISYDDVTTMAEFVGTGADYKNIHSNNHIYGHHFTDNQVGFFHYCVFGNVDEDNIEGYTPRLRENSFWISDSNMNLKVLDQAQTFLHELGHSFGLDADDCWESRSTDLLTGKPNDPIDDSVYPSVMRYGYDILGYSVIDYSSKSGTRTFDHYLGNGNGDTMTISLNDWETILNNIGAGL